MTINEPLLRETMAQIEAHPELWNQSVFFRDTDCGTVGCFAGWAVKLSGYTTTDSLGYTTTDSARAVADGVAEMEVLKYEDDDEETFFPDTGRVAQMLLGLTNDQSHKIFYGYPEEFSEQGWQNRVQEFKQFVSEVTGVDL